MNSNSKGVEVLAATAVTVEKGKHPARIVFCRISREETPEEYQYVSWMEVFPTGNDNPQPFFVKGEYRFDATEGWASFAERAMRLLRLVYIEPVKLALHPLNQEGTHDH